MNCSSFFDFPEHFDYYFDVDQNSDGSRLSITPLDVVRYHFRAHWQATLCDLGYGSYEAFEDAVLTDDDTFIGRLNEYYNTDKYLEDDQHFAVKLMETLMRHLPLSDLEKAI